MEGVNGVSTGPNIVSYINTCLALTLSGASRRLADSTSAAAVRLAALYQFGGMWGLNQTFLNGSQSHFWRLVREAFADGQTDGRSL